ncbi:MAG TPA: mercuric transporter MerT family protein [Vicinamibacterales bacterium]|nr:mercuric transporter MerT family protein [Vicinamibacterales bacterium]
MKSGIGAVFAALVASACCLGPVVFTAIGSGALAAASTRLAPVRPLFLTMTLALLGVGFYRSYRAPHTGAACADGSCPPDVNRTGRVVLWIAAAVVVLLAAFPYYAEYLF